MQTLSAVRPTALPPRALLQAYAAGGGYADCYVAEVATAASLESFVFAFYTTPLFKVEQALLRWFASRPSTDADARELARGASTAFAAWNVEGRSADQLLLADFTGRTRSWLMAEPAHAEGEQPCTRLYFGSAVIRRKNRVTGKESMGWGFHALLGFHKAYSRLLLRSAVARLGSAPAAA